MSSTMSSEHTKELPLTAVQSASPTVHSNSAPSAPPKRGLQFWLVFLAICMSTLLSALDLVSLFHQCTSNPHLQTCIPLVRLLFLPPFPQSFMILTAPNLSGWGVPTPSLQPLSSQCLADWRKSLGGDLSC